MLTGLFKISIIIPTYNEANNLPLLLTDLADLGNDVEIIIVDGESQDKTNEIANIYGAKTIKSQEQNRGLQLNIGANKAKGEWFIFLHADSRLSKDWSKKVRGALNKKKYFIYFFKFKINNKNITYRFLEILVNFRSCFFKRPYGDQGLLIHRDTYFKNKGFKKIPLMEDFDFITRLKNKKNLKFLNSSIFTSSRKWEKTNILSQAFKNWNLRRRWLKGDSIESIYFDYYKN